VNLAQHSVPPFILDSSARRSILDVFGGQRIVILVLVFSSVWFILIRGQCHSPAATQPTSLSSAASDDVLTQLISSAAGTAGFIPATKRGRDSAVPHNTAILSADSGVTVTAFTESVVDQWEQPVDRGG
jgi:hypothetical protein